MTYIKGIHTTYEKALNDVLYICSKYEKCKSDIIKKLNEKNTTPEDIENIIKFLEDNKYLDDLRYSKLYASDKFKFNKWGKIKIRLMLIQKQIPETIIHEALSGIDDSEYVEMLKNVIKTKSKTLHETNPFSKKSKLFRHAASKGFEPALISELLGNN
jgi:regulatory protein